MKSKFLKYTNGKILLVVLMAGVVSVLSLTVYVSQQEQHIQQQAASCVAATYNECECQGSTNKCAAGGKVVDHYANVTRTCPNGASGAPVYTCNGGAGAACFCTPPSNSPMTSTAPSGSGGTNGGNPPPSAQTCGTNAQHCQSSCSASTPEVKSGDAMCTNGNKCCADAGSTGNGGGYENEACGNQGQDRCMMNPPSNIKSSCSAANAGVCANTTLNNAKTPLYCCPSNSGSGTPPPATNTLQFSPGKIVFTDQNYTQSQTLSIKNTGTTDYSGTETTVQDSRDQFLLLPGTWNGTVNIPAGGSSSVVLKVSTGSHSAGTYKSTMTFNGSGSSQVVDVTLTLSTNVKVAADMGFRILGVTSQTVANSQKNATVTLNRTSAENFLTSTNILGAASYTATGTFTYDPASKAFVNHNFNLGNLPPGNYLLAMHVDGNLDAQVTQNSGSVTVFRVSSGQKLKTDIVEMTPGDVAPAQGDNFIDIIDFNKLVDCQGKPIAGVCKNDDLNDDGKIDQGDIDLLMLHFGSLGYSIQKPGFTCVMDPACQTGQQALQLCSLVCTRQQ